MNSSSNVSAELICQLLTTDAPASLIINVAANLQPYILNASHNVLRKAIEREGYATKFTYDELNFLAECCAEGSHQAWAYRGKDQNLIQYLTRKLSNRNFKIHPELVAKAIELADKKDLTEDVAEALIEASDQSCLGLSPFFLWTDRLGYKPHTFRFSQNEMYKGRLALALSQNPEAFTYLVEHQVDVRLNENGKPLWEFMRNRNSSSSSMYACISQWAAIHETQHEERNQLNQYFDRISTYHGETHLRDRKDWHTVTDEEGRTTMMVLALNSASTVKSWWDIKKAYPNAALCDQYGRNLWHYFFAKGRNAPSGISTFLSQHCQLQPDSEGRGLVPSVVAMRDKNGRHLSEHEWFFVQKEHEVMIKLYPLASDWFGCTQKEQAFEFSQWLANELYISAKDTTRSVEFFAQVCQNLKEESFVAVDPHILGALVFIFAISNHTQNEMRQSDSPQKLIMALLNHGAQCDLSDERRELLMKKLPTHLSAMILEAFDAAKTRDDFQLTVPLAKDHKSKSSNSL